MLGTRARLTIVDVVVYAVAILMLGFLLEPMYQVFDMRAGRLGTGTVYLFRLIPPAVLATLFIVVYGRAVGGDGG